MTEFWRRCNNPDDPNWQVIREWNIDGECVMIVEFIKSSENYGNHWQIGQQKYTCLCAEQWEFCRHRGQLMKILQQEARQQYGESWSQLSLEEVILDIFNKVKAGQWLGQSGYKRLSIHDIELILDKQHKEEEIKRAIQNLYVAQKLQLNFISQGLLEEFVPFRQKFRFPDEVRQLLADMFAVQLEDWTDYDRCLVLQIEEILDNAPELKRNPTILNTLESYNFPCMQTQSGFWLGLRWLISILERVKNNDQAAEQFFIHQATAWNSLDRISQSLRKILDSDRYRQLQERSREREQQALKELREKNGHS